MKLEDLTDEQLKELHKWMIENPRYLDNQKYGYSLKFGYHVVRLLDESIMILEEHDLDLTRSREVLKAIRRGEWSMDQITEYFDSKMKYLDELYQKSSLRHSPNEEDIKTLLMECLEMHYGSLDKMTDSSKVIDKHIIEAYNSLEKAMRMIK